MVYLGGEAKRFGKTRHGCIYPGPMFLSFHKHVTYKYMKKIVSDMCVEEGECLWAGIWVRGECCQANANIKALQVKHDYDSPGDRSLQRATSSFKICRRLLGFKHLRISEQGPTILTQRVHENVAHYKPIALDYLEICLRPSATYTS